MAATYEPISTQTLGSDSASVTFSSIPSTYTDLILVGSYGGTNTSSVMGFRCNSDSGTNYSGTNLDGTGSTAQSHRSSNTTYGFVTFDIGVSSTVGNCISVTHFMNYSNTTTYKTVLSRSSEADASTYPGAEASVSLWRNTSAISTITIALQSSGNIKTGSSFTLYGVKSA